MAKFNTFSRSWKPISKFNTFNTVLKPCFLYVLLSSCAVSFGSLINYLDHRIEPMIMLQHCAMLHFTQNFWGDWKCRCYFSLKHFSHVLLRRFGHWKISPFVNGSMVMYQSQISMVQKHGCPYGKQLFFRCWATSLHEVLNIWPLIMQMVVACFSYIKYWHSVFWHVIVHMLKIKRNSWKLLILFALLLLIYWSGSSFNYYGRSCISIDR